MPSLRAGLDSGRGKVVGEILSITAVVFSTGTARPETVALFLDSVSALLMECPSDEGAVLSMFGFAFEKSNVRLKSREQTAMNKKMVL